MQSVISSYLLSLGFMPNKLGFKYLSELIFRGVLREDILPLSKKGYVEAAEKFGQKPCTVEKDIQNAISAAWLKGSIDVLSDEFGSTIDMKKGKPSNKHFILTVVEKVGFMIQ
jgi:two-component system response regulator (stage 0 sporulation protein A)